jgi:hypothetical protein
MQKEDSTRAKKPSQTANQDENTPTFPSAITTLRGSRPANDETQEIEMTYMKERKREMREKPIRKCPCIPFYIPPNPQR